MTIDVGAVARPYLNLDAGIHDMEIVQELDALQGRMIDLDPGIDHGNAHAFARSLFQSAAGFVQPERTRVVN